MVNILPARTNPHRSDVNQTRGRPARTTQAVISERAAIARELHDVVAHAVSLMVVQAGTARPMAQQVNQELAGVLETIETTGRGALNELRGLLHIMRATDQTELGPPPDLSRLNELVDVIRRAGVDVRSTISLPADIPAGIGLCAYRAVQEGLTNAMRHADGSPVDLEVTSDSSTLRVRVHTRGRSISRSALGTGTGLIGLRERVLLCGGSMTAGPDATGYLLEVALPLTGNLKVMEDPPGPPPGARS